MYGRYNASCYLFDIAPPYNYGLADMDRITYMLKRREDSRVIARQIFDRIEKRAEHVHSEIAMPSLTVIVE